MLIEPKELIAVMWSNYEIIHLNPCELPKIFK